MECSWVFARVKEYPSLTIVSFIHSKSLCLLKYVTHCPNSTSFVYIIYITPFPSIDPCGLRNFFELLNFCWRGGNLYYCYIRQLITCLALPLFSRPHTKGKEKERRRERKKRKIRVSIVLVKECHLLGFITLSLEFSMNMYTKNCCGFDTKEWWRYLILGIWLHCLQSFPLLQFCSLWNISLVVCCCGLHFYTFCNPFLAKENTIEGCLIFCYCCTV